MPIDVICPSCHSRFKVSDKFAGKKGPCPKCKSEITVPDKSEEVVVHAPDEFGPKNAEGKATLKPIQREETKISAVGIVGIVGSVVLVFVMALVLRLSKSDDGVSIWILGAGALILGPPLAVAGYSFLRNDELEPYRGSSLILRASICGVVNAMIWGVYAYAANMLLGGNPPELFHLVVLIPVMVVAGCLAPLASLDLDVTSACIHYGLYLGVCVLLRLVIGLTPF